MKNLFFGSGCRDRGSWFRGGDILLFILASCFLILASLQAFAQADNPNHSKIPVINVYNTAYVKALYAKYPTVKSNFCRACKLWVNPYYKSIADTARHMPVITYELFTKANYALVAKLKVPRTGIFAAWHPTYGQPSEDGVYVAANKIVKPNKDEIAKGHCQAWILNAFSYDSAILSDTYTFNAAMEDQGQNVGTEIASENLTRQTLANNDVQVWCGTYDAGDPKLQNQPHTFTDGKVTDTYPAIYWKIIKYGAVTLCYWMPNKKTEAVALLPQRVITYQQLVSNLGFDPEKVLN